jgi:hypothetical protein
MDTSFDEQENLLLVKETEWRDSSWIKFFRIYPQPESTEELALKYKKEINPDTREIILTTKAYKIFLVFIGSLLSIAFLLAAFNKETESDTRVFVILFVLVFQGGILYEILNRNRNFKIIAGKEGLLIKNHLYGWSEIKKIYIFKRIYGRGSKIFINISLGTPLNDKIEITNHNFISRTKKLSAYIEFFRKKI